ncbi:MAG: serine/threonine protein kinase, partial [Planctomycetes bacterium]|nr:serine/threonine protein kinase [Planctomycetota bacterium]
MRHTLPAPMATAPSIPGYTLQHRLAAGRHGGVWVAMRAGDGVPAAVKVVQADRVVDGARFLREAAALSAIEHRHVVRCLESGRADDQLWLAMELAAGDLATEVRAGPSPASAVLEAGRDVALGLAELHRRGLVHRDITPANLLRMPDGRVALGDFGLVRGDQERLTRTGDIIGTPAYISPEQAGGGAVDARADIYALGAVLFALATGRPPYQGDNAWGMLSRIAAGPFPDPREADPDIMPQLRAIILAATGLRPEDRYAEAALLAEDCAAVLAGGIPRHA